MYEVYQATRHLQILDTKVTNHLVCLLKSYYHYYLCLLDSKILLKDFVADSRESRQTSATQAHCEKGVHIIIASAEKGFEDVTL